MDAFSVRRRVRGGFTLVEMLTVVVIIGMLAALVAGAAVMAQTAVKKARIKAEIAALDMALKAYKEKFGEYPPDFSDANAVKAHLAMAFPRASNLNVPTTGGGAAALVFWLGGQVTNGVPTGFSANPSNPLDANTSRIGPFFDFDTTRLTQVNGAWVYLPPGVGDTDPYVYFRTYNDNNKCSFTHSDGNTSVSPAKDANNIYCNPSSFQILAAGLDGRYGIPAGSISSDDLGNFTDENQGP